MSQNHWQNHWDEKAKNYSRFNAHLEGFEAEFWAKLDEFDVSLKHKNVIDIGCGTGVRTLRLALSASSVLGIDSSEKMLDILAKDSAKMGLKNVKTLQTSWQDFNALTCFDLAFCTMSPALSSQSDFIKFINCAKKRVYLGWAKPRHSDILEIFKPYDEAKAQPALELEELLKTRQIPYKRALMQEKRKAIRSLDEMSQNIAWHLKMSSTNITQDEIKSELARRFKSEKIEEKISSLMLVLVF